MEELKFSRELAAIADVAARAEVDRSDWSMAREPGSLAFFDGILSGIERGKSYHLKEDLIFEILSHLSRRQPAFRRYFEADWVFADFGYPFGDRDRPRQSTRGVRATSPLNLSPTHARGCAAR